MNSKLFLISAFALCFFVAPAFASSCGGVIGNGTLISTDDQNQNSTAWLIKEGMPSTIDGVVIHVAGGGGGIDDTIVSAYLDGSFVGTVAMSKDNQSFYDIVNSSSFTVADGNFSFVISQNQRSAWMSTLGDFDSGSSYCMGDSSCSNGVGFIYANVRYSSGYGDIQCFGDNIGVCDGSGWINGTCQFGCNPSALRCYGGLEIVTTSAGGGLGFMLSAIAVPLGNFLLLLGVIAGALAIVYAIAYTIKNSFN